MLGWTVSGKGKTHECKLHGAAETRGGGFVGRGPAVGHVAGDGEVGGPGGRGFDGHGAFNFCCYVQCWVGVGSTGLGWWVNLCLLNDAGFIARLIVDTLRRGEWGKVDIGACVQGYGSVG